ncbi:DUF5708 family protein [Streptomyces sp. NPDC058676]|uniref:DUF5708 family protein n=1 Tax=unclassified Streptomyces TaxID=2593676 RepID=UPI00365AF49E
MSKAMKNLLEGVGTFGVGLVLWLFTGDVQTSVVTLTKVGVVMMCVGGALVLVGLVQALRPPAGG